MTDKDEAKIELVKDNVLADDEKTIRKNKTSMPDLRRYAKPYGNRSTPYCDSFVCCDVAACKLGWLGLGAAR